MDADHNCIGRFLRLKVNINIKQPLIRVLHFDHEGKEIKIPLQYERLAEWCYHYGIIGHVEYGCPTKSPNSGGSSSPPVPLKMVHGSRLKDTRIHLFHGGQPQQDPFHVSKDSDEEVAPYHVRQSHNVTFGQSRNRRLSSNRRSLSTFQASPSIEHPLPNPSQILPYQPSSSLNPPLIPNPSPTTSKQCPVYPSSSSKLSPLSTNHQSSSPASPNPMILPDTECILPSIIPASEFTNPSTIDASPIPTPLSIPSLACTSDLQITHSSILPITSPQLIVNSPKKSD
ncbi:OLC1v1024779C1 [Oldenlandia corymbosa var. corymbosa]|uniref:OLC1v1024779C1 n=1 Tax=Oldenlandia corymbosa var. corymbosa TaxID=529605 RepID=A0AAV1C3A5_OLDCO|nr:OLC1v1024779C1 [Oldenlandia corymbosa var. corymbosa]